MMIEVLFLKYIKFFDNLECLGCNLVATPLVCNEKLMKDGGERKVDETLYRKLVDSLLWYYVYKKLTFKIHEQSQSHTLRYWKKRFEIYPRHSELWSQIYKSLGNKIIWFMQ